ncbi:hypothetical protein Tco_0392805 [Tanacetum coccineum]
MLGDINVTLAPNEHSSGSSFMIGDMNEFRDCINNIEIEDVDSSGLFYTWTKNLFKVKAGNTSGALKKLGQAYMITTCSKDPKTPEQRSPDSSTLQTLLQDVSVQGACRQD